MSVVRSVEVLAGGVRSWALRLSAALRMGVAATSVAAGVALTALAVAASRGRNGAVWWILASVATGGALALLGWTYRSWIGDRVALHSVGAVVGCAVTAGGAAVLRVASDHSRPGFAVVGVTAILLGLTPVAFAIRFEASTDDAGTGGLPRRWAWLLNAALTFAATVPLMVFLAVPWRVGLIVAGIWVVAAALRHAARHAWFKRFATGAAVVAAACVVWVLIAPSSESSVGQNSLFIGLGLAILVMAADAVSVWARHWNGLARPTRRQLMAACGAAGALLVVAGLWLSARVGEAPGGLKLLVIAACVGVGFGFVARGQGFVAVALIGGLMVWAVTNRTTEESEYLQPAEGSSGRIIAVGDSYIAGEGAPMFFDGVNVSGGNGCRRSPTSYPYRLAKQNNMGLDFVACSGAVANQVTERPQAPSTIGPVGGLPQLDNRFSTFDPTLVLVSIGGNDAFFGDVGRGCALPGTCAELSEIWNGNLNNVEQRVAETLTAVAAAFPGAPVIVVPYPQMFADTDSCSGLPLDSKEVAYLRGFVNRLNDSVHRAVDTVKAANGFNDWELAFFSPGIDAYRDARLCGGAPRSALPLNIIKLDPTDGTPYQRLLPTNWLHGSFHPNPSGHRLMADLLQAHLSTHYKAFGAPTDVVPVFDQAPERGVSVTSCADAERDVCRQRVSAWMSITTITAFRQIAPPGFLLALAGWLFGVAFVRSRWRHRPLAASFTPTNASGAPAREVDGHLTMTRNSVRFAAPLDGAVVVLFEAAWSDITDWAVIQADADDGHRLELGGHDATFVVHRESARQLQAWVRAASPPGVAERGAARARMPRRPAQAKGR